MKNIITLGAGIVSVASAVFVQSLANAQCVNDQILLQASDSEEGDEFGNHVSIDGDVMVTGATGVNEHRGAVYVFRKVGDDWIEEAKIFASDGEPDDSFGKSVCIRNDMIAVGAVRGDGNEIDSGAVYIFRYDGAVWQEEAKFIASDGRTWDSFGEVLDVYGDFAVIGVDGDDTNGNSSGAAYVFRHVGGVWSEETKLIPLDNAENDAFGRDVVCADNSILVGAFGDDNENGIYAGAVYVFRYVDSEWVEEQKLLASNGEPNDNFGFSVALNDTALVVGAIDVGTQGNVTGAAYVFRLSDGTWTEEAKLLASDGSHTDWFGSSVAVVPDKILVAASRDSSEIGNQSGSVYLFQHHNSSWSEVAKLTASNGRQGDYFGLSVAASGSTAVVGKPNSSKNYEQTIHVFPGLIPCTNLTEFHVVKGTLLDGTLADIEYSDNHYVKTRSGFGETLADLHKMEMTAKAVTTVDAPSNINLRIEAHINQISGLATVSLRDLRTNRFVALRSYSIGMNDEIILISTGNAVFYVNGFGEIDLSIKHVVFVPFLAFQFESFIDLVEIRVN